MNPESPHNPGSQPPTPYGPQPQPPVQPGVQPGYGQAYGQPFDPTTQQPVPQQPVQAPFGAGYPPQAPAPNPSSQLPAGSKLKNRAKKWIILTFIFIFTTLSVAALAVYVYLQYDRERTTVDAQVTEAVAIARKDEQDKAAERLLAAENEPNRLFTGPDDYGRLTFNYSKLWSVYVAKDAASGGTYEAYLNPVTVPQVARDQQYALRVLIEQRDYDAVLKTYERAVTNGDLTTTTINADGETGARLDGKFSDDIRGAAVIFKIRDKTVTLRTDADTFKPAFDELITTITFNK